MRLLFHPEAETELSATFDYYESRQEGAGCRFAEAFADALASVLEQPQLYAIIEGTFRLCRLRRFPYGIVYEVCGNAIVVVAVMHLHRQPGYWRSRME